LDIYAYLAEKVYGTPTPTDTDVPTHGRSNTIAFAKKAISFFMPNRLMVWNEATQEGNPTRSTMVNELIKKVKKQEVRKQGKDSQARRAMQLPEFRELITRLRGRDGHMQRYTAAAYFIFQFNLIARLDDVMHFRYQDLTPSLEHPFAIKSKMCWSKNVLEERDAPDQMLMGAKDPTFCVLLALGLHLVHNIVVGNVNEEGSLFGVQKGWIYDLLKSVTGEADFPIAEGGMQGTLVCILSGSCQRHMQEGMGAAVMMLMLEGGGRVTKA